MLVIEGGVIGEFFTRFFSTYFVHDCNFIAFLYNFTSWFVYLYVHCFCWFYTNSLCFIRLLCALASWLRLPKCIIIHSIFHLLCIPSLFAQFSLSVSIIFLLFKVIILYKFSWHLLILYLALISQLLQTIFSAYFPLSILSECFLLSILFIGIERCVSFVFLLTN